jgi:aldehyde:ferredoxin oxidoreductase
MGRDRKVKMGGYAGKVLKVNLTTGAIETEPLDMELAKKFIGPEGINFRWAYDLLPPKMDPYSETCPIILGAGPIVGTPVPGSSRVVALFKHPNFGGVIENPALEATLANAEVGGLRLFDHHRKADKPVYLNIHNDEVKICDGSRVWGKDIYETTDVLWETHDNASVLAIGPAGERMVKTTVALIDKVNTIGRADFPQ